MHFLCNTTCHLQNNNNYISFIQKAIVGLPPFLAFHAILHFFLHAHMHIQATGAYIPQCADSGCLDLALWWTPVRSLPGTTGIPVSKPGGAGLAEDRTAKERFPAQEVNNPRPSPALYRIKHVEFSHCVHRTHSPTHPPTPPHPTPHTTAINTEYPHWHVKSSLRAQRDQLLPQTCLTTACTRRKPSGNVRQGHWSPADVARPPTTLEQSLYK